MMNALNSMTQQHGDATGIKSAVLDQARQQLGEQFDKTHAGFGKAPKFPHPSNLERLLRHWQQSKTIGNEDTDALNMLRMTLHAMASGGLFDQLGGGFFRYSVDDYWMIPHFEKMLYDNGPLLSLYTQAYAYLRDPVFARICHETASWVMREMQTPDGGYYSTLDADSEGEEGKFYVWQTNEVKNMLSQDEYAVFADVFGVNRQPNFEGHYHLHVFEDLQDVADKHGLTAEQANALLDSARKKLFDVREQRIRPGRDDKVLTAWNGLMIKGMAQAARILNEPRYLDSALAATHFIQREMVKDGRLLASYKDGQARLNAYLDDYAFLLDALLELLQARWRARDLSFAIELAEVVLQHFQDPQGGFFFTSDDHEALIQRPKPNHDDATPSGNGIAAKVLGRLGHLLGESRYLHAAENTLKASWPEIQSMPHGHASLLLALEESLFPLQTVIIRGSDAATADWQSVATRPYAPRRLTLTIPETVEQLPGQLGERSPRGEVVAYVCSGHTCSVPLTDSDDFKARLTDTDIKEHP